jgi:bacteriorhodopsin
MSMDSTWLFLCVLFGSFGLAFFVYGRRQKKPVPLVCGLALMVVPYFVSNNYLLSAISVGLIALPYFVRI